MCYAGKTNKLNSLVTRSGADDVDVVYSKDSFQTLVISSNKIGSIMLRCFYHFDESFLK